MTFRLHLFRIGGLWRLAYLYDLDKEGSKKAVPNAFKARVRDDGDNASDNERR